MSITTADLANEIRNLGLDAEGTTYYNDSRDIAPAINAACRWIAQVATFANGTTRYKGEALAELKAARVFLTNQFSRIKIPDDVWSIESVHPLPVVEPAGIISDPTDPLESKEQTALIHYSAPSSAKRLTIEEWDTNKNNPFQPGNVTQASECENTDAYDFAYLDMFSYPRASDSAGAYNNMIEIRPYIPNQLTTIFVVNTPSAVSAVGTVYSPATIPFSDRLRNLIIEKSLNYIARRQGDNTTTYSVTAADIQQLMSIL